MTTQLDRFALSEWEVLDQLKELSQQQSFRNAFLTLCDQKPLLLTDILLESESLPELEKLHEIYIKNKKDQIRSELTLQLTPVVEKDLRKERIKAFSETLSIKPAQAKAIIEFLQSAKGLFGNA
ncbi:hypothetical protein [Nodosilinea nodulosa]|uniref:hypothetical protein n=1 Tax=Nodosilinea nodulosa TaxID=416001 RepID=UPI00035EE6B7|nr:hypothetical protein [Nodosilinea nodulosa]